MKNSVSILLVGGIILLLNVLSRQLFFRIDLTEGKQYTLSKASKDILRNLEDPVTVKAYFSEDLPANVAKTKRDFQDMLIEYANLSKGNVDYEFVNPNDDPAVEQEAMQSGISPVMINVREKDQVKQQKAFMGAVIKLGDQQDVIPFVQPGGAMEYALTTGIKKLAVVDKPSIGLIQGHGEPGFQELSQAYQSLSILYNVEMIDLPSVDQIDLRFKTVAMVGPSDTIRSTELAKLDGFLDRGGYLFLAFDRVNGDLQTASGSAIDLGLVTWLANKGIVVDDSFVTDASCGNVTVQQRNGFMTFNNQVSFPFLPLIKKFGEHPITEGLEQVIFEFASPIRFLGDSSFHFTPLVTSSENSGSVKVPTYFDVQKQWTQADFPQQHLPIAALVEGNFGQNPAKLIVVSNGTFPVSGQRGQNPDNVSLMVNSIDWLSDDTGLIELRTKGVSSRPIDELEDGRRSFLKYLNFLLPIALILVYGFLRGQKSKNMRLQRMQERWI
ncbi:MAG: GldG family protein [Saprospiraceae bacterium]|nr:GldG family protein [Saprospiraceae bacterium]